VFVVGTYNEQGCVKNTSVAVFPLKAPRSVHLFQESGMRKRRAIIFDDDIVITGLLKKFFILRDYDVVIYNEPLICPIYLSRTECDTNGPCADIMIVDYSMPVMNGIELLKAQQTRKCGLELKNKALITGYADVLDRSAIDELGCAFFEKPLNFNRLAAWFDECERRMDLSHPLGLLRRENRQPWEGDILFEAGPSAVIHTGVAVNRSPSGLCLRTAVPLWPDQFLAIHSKDHQSTRPAAVRWIREIADNSYLVGLQLVGVEKEAATASLSASHP
jgi:CheY-like chemotaxis protein